ncbi:L-type lectin-domain containing receptor kinase S.4-like [Cucurbita maxima]|uniref:non-specific serine/threonine protein kinase n=1 Tax=Cucurbita maxima TaxID=3661 RepID=A0A6J1IS30_CUCMA|nr:L-type lectin-domain containing receptor kinase S.4-like [Cucurbita maxima]
MASSVLFITIFSALIFLSTQTLSQHTQLFYPGFNASTNLTLKQYAGIENNGVLRLTNYSPDIIGQAFYATPIQFKNSSTAAHGGSSNGKVFSFSTCFAFCIIPEDDNYVGHGFTFAIVPSKNLSALSQTYLGLFNRKPSTHIFAVEFDTIQTVEVKDIDNNHVGIDLNSLISNVSKHAAYFDDSGQLYNLTLKSGKPVKAWIDYDSREFTLNVTISPFYSKPRKPLLSYRVDLSSIFNENMYIGFTASTGILAHSSHYILGWSFAINGKARDLELSSLPLPKQRKTGAKISLSVYLSVTAASFFAISVFAFGIHFLRKHKKSNEIELWELQMGPHRYSYRELKKGTRNFSEKEILGFGGSGKVYRGTLPISKTEIAVKRIFHNSKQGLREFVTEIATIGRLRHRNLVQLLGWCRRGQDLLIVYEYMANGSLDNYLFDDPKTILNWEQRSKVIKGVASALLYLHEGYKQVVIHRDVKASNVLLDGELNGRLGDFGLAKVYDHGSVPVTTRVVGTLGYLAPELPRTGKSTTSSDVYAFGALMLEVVCGRRPVEVKALPEEMTLVDWVWDKYREGRLLAVVDPKLRGDYDEVEAAMVLKLGVMCSNNEPKQRPSMRQIVQCLNGEIGVADEWKAPDGGSNGGAVGDFVVSFTSLSIT